MVKFRLRRSVRSRDKNLAQPNGAVQFDDAPDAMSISDATKKRNTSVIPSVFNPEGRTLLRESGPTPANPAYWETRLLRGTFTAEARPGSEKELFVRFEHEGRWIYFPLESSVPAEAAIRACDIYRLLTASGWD